MIFITRRVRWMVNRKIKKDYERIGVLGDSYHRGQLDAIVEGRYQLKENMHKACRVAMQIESIDLCRSMTGNAYRGSSLHISRIYTLHACMLTRIEGFGKRGFLRHVLIHFYTLTVSYLIVL